MKKNNILTITDRKIKVGLAGCGRISANHFNAIMKLNNDLILAAVCDVNSETLEDVKTKYDVNGYSDFISMLSQENLDIVIICTASGLHAEQTIIAAQHGVHVICEKPMAIKYEDGLRMVRACEKAGVHLFVVKQNRLNSTIQLLKRAVDDNRFGNIKMVNINVFWTRPQEYYDQDQGWRGTLKFDGGAFMNQASHYADLAVWLIGPVKNVQSMMSTTRNIETEDTGVVNIKWCNGAIGSMSVTMLTYPKNLEGSITILGESGSAKVGGLAVNEIHTWDFADEQDYDKEVSATNYKTQSVYGSGHELYYENVINVMRGKAKPSTDGHDGLKSLEFLSAIYSAANEGSMIELPLNFDTKEYSVG